ncbi:MAG: hypothetical protein ACI8RD_011173, partial [Bacillariaceae sp.]
IGGAIRAEMHAVFCHAESTTFKFENKQCIL